MHTSPVTVTVTVAGHGEATYAPERCTISLSVQFDGPTAERAGAPTAQLVQELSRKITALHDSAHGPVNWWSLDQTRQSRHRPYNSDGEQLPYVYRASAAIEVKFSRLAAIDAFVSSHSSTEGVSIGHFDWALTTRSRAKHVMQVRDLAVRDAMAKAKTYAASIGRSTINPVAIADRGMLGVGASGGNSMGARAYQAGGSGDDSSRIKPENITLQAEVHARFEAW
ncbi:SIMPL domain-containing protein [Rhodococcus sp. D2-41]|uniref:SIMPL domain-containing protein n=1 Tax=Speluncibacter jeojiensis TaxID=2710754 RepID=UPI00240F2CA0|nr:SIMPL domain-containing protein [Rhodococcus sp. D2-41]MDG3012625.1 SIMPL domain-containing protein [Rhodococcus sp. D2-41]